MRETFDYIRDGAAIYARSFAIIRAEADLARFTPDEAEVATRMIHAAGLVELARDIVFAPGMVAAARAALAAGAAVHGGTPARALRKSAGGWSVETPTGTVTAEKILIATNGFTDDLWQGLRRTVLPVFSAIAASEPLGAERIGGILPGRPSVYESGRITVYYRIDAQGRLLMGGRGPMRPIATPDALAYLTDYAAELWPRLAGIAWTHGWNSRLAMTEDHWPHVHEPAPDVLIYLGCNGRGVALGTAIADQLASRLVHGEAFAIDLPIVAPRPIFGHALWPLAVGSVVLHGRIMDRLGL